MTVGGTGAAALREPAAVLGRPAEALALEYAAGALKLPTTTIGESRFADWALFEARRTSPRERTSAWPRGSAGDRDGRAGVRGGRHGSAAGGVQRARRPATAGVQALNVPKILIVSPLVLAELDHLLHTRAGERAAVDGRIPIAAIDGPLLTEAEELMRRHLGTRLGLADRVHAALAWRLTRPALLSFDKHYGTARPSLSQARPPCPDSLGPPVGCPTESGVSGGHGCLRPYTQTGGFGDELTM
ncbi:hypothetical protein [Kitasatospora sp. NPDC059327]|uniref:hypothetical protein n=1 Tax=Kitasatospora sp. NPDC059327 TaxID=3346803 RepID=UPI0036918973